ncbi:hypothetical protein, partial [uncultured Dysosmobacter sp.]|uniref:hypothetical protein n=1 Tax=uncultured Dysosmobacter sp. TaxID=2591384 RepID=UPI002602125D
MVLQPAVEQAPFCRTALKKVIKIALSSWIALFFNPCKGFLLCSLGGLDGLDQQRGDLEQVAADAVVG